MNNEVITGTLEGFQVQTMPGAPLYVIWGYIHGDVKERFKDGTSMHTAGVLEKDFPHAELKEGDIVRTMNSIYKLGQSVNDMLAEALKSNNK